MKKRERRKNAVEEAEAVGSETDLGASLDPAGAELSPGEEGSDPPAVGPEAADPEGAALLDEDWDGPTREVAPEEMGALALESTEEIPAETANEAVSGDGVPTEAPLSDEDLTQPEVTVEVQAEGDQPGAAAEVASDAEPAPEGDVSPGRLESIIESLLFASERPLTLADFKRLTGERQVAKLTAAVESLQARREDTGIQLISVAGGWHLRTPPENAAWVSRLVAGKPVRLSRAMLETLAIVAYRQPVTRPEIDEIRGVDCGPVLGTLLDRGLVRIIGKKEEVGRPMLYGTTPEFLRTFSLKDLTELPTLREFHELSEAHRDELAKVDGERAPADIALGESGDGGQAAPPPVRRPPPARQVEPDGDDELIAELERASSAAAAATSAPNPTDEGGAPAGGAASVEAATPTTPASSE